MLATQPVAAQTMHWTYSGRTPGPSGFSRDFVKELAKGLKDHKLLQEEILCYLLSKAADTLRKLPNVVDIKVQQDGKVHIVGDIHGQYFDLYQILQIKGDPSPSNQYVFNGDFVDRGVHGVEVATLLMGLKVAYPKDVHLNRGNHEVERINSMYGFREEVHVKYSARAYACFREAFCQLPLATLVNGTVLILHGGLSRQDGVKISDMQKISRAREPSLSDELMMDILWSDPMQAKGRARSQRGAGVLFGPDVTENFCTENGLLCIVRSHEVMDRGFEWCHEKCLTVFSAANYCGVQGNLGAVIDVKGPSKGQPLTRDDLQPWQYDTAEPPRSRL